MKYYILLHIVRNRNELLVVL